MRRFKVKDLLISPISVTGFAGGGALLNAGPCIGPKAPRTDRPCADLYTDNCIDDPKTTKAQIPCKNSGDTTPCGAYSDTGQDCADNATYRPCIQAGTEPACPKNHPTTNCADNLPKDDNTKFRCWSDQKGKRDTVGVCQGGTDTTVPGTPRFPWHGCKNQPQTTVPCSDNSNTTLECFKGSNTVASCVLNPHTGGVCSKDSNTLGFKDQFTDFLPCGNKSNSDWACREKSDTHWCRTDSKTVSDCYTPQTENYCKDPEGKTQLWCSHEDTKCGNEETTYDKCYFTCASCTAFPGTNKPWASAGQVDPGLAALGCPPLSPLQLPLDHPLAFDALAVLQAELSIALGKVESRKQDAAAALQPKTLAEAEEIERMLEKALTDLRAIKKSLAESPPTVARKKGGPKRRKKD